ncbi:MAG: PilZ domain-containing protein [Endomicrobium sp.]|jgi:uncharacterized protein YuzE|nr:PilZ domain-containing protein [Endomicrobium sp.]
MLEKRKSVRRFAAMNILCYYPDNQNEADKCVLVNISKGGVGIESKKIFRAGERVKIIFNAAKDEEVSAIAEILYSQEGSFGFFYGAKYCDASAPNRALLNNYLLKYFNLY